MTRVHSALYASVSALALFASGALSSAAAADFAGMLSPGALAQSAGARTPANAASTSNAAVLANPAIQAQQALSAANLSKAAQAIKDVTAAQAAARASSQLRLNNAPLSGSTWSGTALSGLQPVNDSDPNLWINAKPLQKDVAAKTATVEQTDANAVLKWRGFDLDADETLVFDQQGHADWNVLNRAEAGPRNPDGSRFIASPTTILGKVKADGAVYVINPNGIIFGPTAQINVHSLIASSLDVGNPLMTEDARNAFFLNTGILGNGGSVPPASFSYDPRDTKVEGDVRVEAGAIIQTSLAPRSLSPDAGGSVYLFAPHVENDGSIITPAGETLLASAQQVQLMANAYPDGGISPISQDTEQQTFRAVGVNTTFSSLTVPFPVVWRTDGPETAQISEPGSVINRGLIDAERGVVILNGDNVTNGKAASGQGAIIRANTSITRNGEVFLDARITLTLDGSIQVLPDVTEETIPQSAVATFRRGSIEMKGVTVNLQPGALLISPGGDVTATTGNLLAGIYPDQVRLHLPDLASRIYVAPDAAIDVSGLDAVTLPMSANLITFKPFGNEFADQPLQRQGALRGQSLTVDIRDSGTLNGVDWIGTPLANVKGFVNTIQRTLNELLTSGGNVTLSAPSTGEIILRQGSSINVAGGYVQYEAGAANTSKLLTADGRVVDIAQANPLDTYIGIAGVSTDEHPKWGVSQTFSNPLFDGGDEAGSTRFQDGYIEGHDAGGIVLSAGSFALDGTFYAGAVAGERQAALGVKPTAGAADALFNANTMPRSGLLQISGRSDVTISADIARLPNTFNVDTALPASRQDVAQLSANALSSAQFGTISVNFSGRVDVTNDAALSVVPGGEIDLSGGSVALNGTLTAHSGSISALSTSHIGGDLLGQPQTAYIPTGPDRPIGVFDVAVGPNAVLDVSGQWVNDTAAMPQDLIGGAYVDGGTVQLQTSAQSAICTTVACRTLPGLKTTAIVDLTGDIVLAGGAKIDVSSGGRVSDRGLLQLDAQGRPVGKGGSLSLRTYVGSFTTERAPVPPTTGPLTAGIVLPGSDGSAAGNASALDNIVDAYGFASGGTLSVKAVAITLGEAGGPGTFALPADYLKGNAFGAYEFIGGSLTVAPGTMIALDQRNLLAGADLVSLPTGAKVSAVASVGYLPAIQRAPVNLTLEAALAPLPPVPYDPAVSSPAAKVALRVGEGAEIDAEPGADITIGVTGRKAFNPTGGQGSFPAAVAQQFGVAEILGTVRAPGGTITVTADNGEIWLGAASRLDVAGAVVPDALLPFAAGKIRNGGTVSISSADETSALVALEGAAIDVSGTAASFDLLRDDAFSGLSTTLRESVPVWSDAGNIVFSIPTLLFDGHFAAHSGADGGRGGSLTITTPVTTRQEITILQSGNVVPVNLAPGDDLNGILKQQFSARVNLLPSADTDPNAKFERLLEFAFFQADRLTDSGISDVRISAGPADGDAIGTQGQFAPGRIAFQGDVTIAGLDRLVLDSSRISLLDSSGGYDITPPSDPAGCNVCLDAYYAALRGSDSFFRAAPRAGKGIFQLSGDNVDIAAGGSSASGAGGVLTISGTAKARFVSRGDLRLRVPLANIPLRLSPGTVTAGEVLTQGDLVLQGAQIYPISGVDITLKSLGPTATIAFEANGAAGAAPLSAGGQVTASAAHIQQSGKLIAPLGVIRLGARNASELSPNDPSPDDFVRTLSVSLTDQSLTSVSLAGETVPFGETANGSSWSYDSQTGEPLSALPAKKLALSGSQIDASAGATLDVSGGGTIQAMEFVPGIGGTRDVLKGANVDAIIPGYAPGAAPLDQDFLVQQKDATPLAGSKVFLSGGPDLPAGYYTLLPAHYATLPGAYRVSLVANTLDARASENTVLADGTLRLAGYFAEPGLGTQDSRKQFFDVQSSDVWRQYSEIDHLSGTDFFGAKTDPDTGLVPRLPLDAGHLVVTAVTTLNLGSLIETSAASGGRRAKVDIAARNLEIVSPGAAVTTGYSALAADKLTGLGADSLLLGGVRDDKDNVRIVATGLEVANGAGAPLEAPEIILVSNTGDSLRFDANSVVRAVGEASDPLRAITIGHQHDSSDPLDPPSVSGNAALVAVSNGSPVAVTRENLPKPTTDPFNAPIVIQSGALLDGNSLTLDSTGSIVTGGATLAAAGGEISIGARAINFGQIAGTPAGLKVDPGLRNQLVQAKTLTLHSIANIAFYGDADFSLGASDSRLVLDAPALQAIAVAGQAGNVTLGAQDIELRNSADAASGAAGLGTLNINALHTLTLGAGDKVLAGFGTVALSGANGIIFRDSGSLSVQGANIAFAAPAVIVGTGAAQTVITGGSVAFNAIAGSAVAGADEIGGVLTVNSASISLGANSLLQAFAGGIDLEAVSGDVSLGSGAKILAHGYEETFYDVTRSAPGGDVRLIADSGNIAVAADATIDVSSAVERNGEAGSVSLIAAHGRISSNGAAFATSTIAGSLAGDSGGRLKIDTQSLGIVSLSVAPIFSDTVDIRVGQGDLGLASDLIAANVTLTADRGAVTIAHTIDASGTKGGQISLFGGQGVTLTSGGALLARATDATEHGGSIFIGTGVAGSNGGLQPGVIDLQGGVIDVSNLANAANGGTVRLRAPLISGDSDVAINAVHAGIIGAASVTVEGYRVFDTRNSAFTGTINPASQPGFYGQCTVTSAGPVCSGTLMDFVQGFALSAASRQKFVSIDSTKLHLQPGIELVNDGGDINVTGTWNLGAGTAGFLLGDIEGFLTGNFTSFSGGLFPLVNKVDFVQKGVIIAPAGTAMTDNLGNLLPQFAAYNGALIFDASVSVNATVVTDQFGKLLPQYKSYKGPLVVIDGVSEVNPVVTDQFGNLLPQFATYSGKLIFKNGVSATTRMVVTDQYGTLVDQFQSYSGDLFFVQGISQITSLYYRVGGQVTGEPGTLTLRASGDVNIGSGNNAVAITDGFFSTRNVFDANYLEKLTAQQSPFDPSQGGWLNVAVGGTNYNNVGGYQIAGATYLDPIAIGRFAPGPAPTAPYDPAANAISPVFSGKDKAPITGADLFPLLSDANGAIHGFDGNYRAIDSWSYRITGGADTASANPLALRPLSDFADAANPPDVGHGNVVLSGSRQFAVADLNLGSNVLYETPTIVRTGTGSIDVAAARDFLANDNRAPGVIYTAGRNSVALPDPEFTLQTIDDPLNPGATVTIPFASNAAGFLEPIVLNCSFSNNCNPYGPYGQAAFPVEGGHITLTAQRDIIGFEHPIIASPGNGTGFANQQYFAPWLLAQGTALALSDFGVFSPMSGYLSTGEVFTPSQTAWWINFGSFDQGLLSAGGDVRVEAGRDIQELSVSLPTTGRVSGGLSATLTGADGSIVANVPVLHVNGSGDLIVIVGRDLKSGAFYEGSGAAAIRVGGSVSASWADRPDPTVPRDTFPVSTVLALDTGTMTLTARGNLDIAGVLSGASLQNVADLTQKFDVLAQQVSTYGPSSGLAVQSISGDLVTNSLAFPVALVNSPNVFLNLGSDPSQGYPGGEGYAGIGRYPASFEAVALRGDVTVANPFRLAPSDEGTLNLLAFGSLHASTTSGDVRPISTGPSLIEAAFSAANPLAGFGPSEGSFALDLGAHLLHTNDSVRDLLYAVTGDIISGVGRVSTTTERPLTWEIDKPATIRAARDIVDLSFFGQNLHATDVTEILAGGDIYYTGALQQLIGLAPGVLGEPANLGGLSLAGPGFFTVEAGGNLGPFVTASADIAASQLTAPDPTGTGIITFGNTLTAGNRRLLSDQNPALANAFAKGTNDQLPRQGADIITLFGTGGGADYTALEQQYILSDPAPFNWLSTGPLPSAQEVIERYVDPANPNRITRSRDYAPLLQNYVQSLGRSGDSVEAAWSAFQTLKPEEQATLAARVVANELRVPAALREFIADLGPGGATAFANSPALRHIFDYQVLFGELTATGDSAGCCFKSYALGYSAIETLFPPAAGYTDNSKSASGQTGSNNPGFGEYPDAPAAPVRTGDLELLHATIKTMQSTKKTITADSITTDGTAIVENPNTTAQERSIGGNVMILGPGGSINAGTTATEINSKLTNSSLGILTLDNGVIDIFTDSSVLVNQSRILTVQGGDLAIWSSNVDIDAGRGAKTSIDFKPLSVDFNPAALPTINLNGLVSGAGIGTVRSTPDAPPASVFLIAPRGTVNFGDAGVRSTLNIDVAALSVANAANVAAGGTTTGIGADVSVNLGALQNTSSVAAGAAQAAEDAASQAANRAAPAPMAPAASLITVEVLGFGNCDPEAGMQCQQRP